jgi:iron complex outermembrane receptor protein
MMKFGARNGNVQPRSAVSAFALAFSLAAVATPAFGQAAPPQAAPSTADALDNSGELAPTDEIIVSARRREESVQDVPQTVNVVTSAQIDKLNIRTFAEVASVVPGLTLTGGSSFGSAATIRGVAFSPEASGNNPTVEFYVNDAPVSSNIVFQSLFDVGQFEVQRGPQDTLRGRASPSGSILFTTRRPDLNEFGAVVNGTLTSLDARKLDAAVNVPVINDVLAVRVAGVIDDDKGNRVFTVKPEAYPLNDNPMRKTRALRASVLFEPTEWLTANVMAQRLDNLTKSYLQVQSACLVTGAACPTTSVLIRPFDRRSNEDRGSSSNQRHDVLVGNVDVRFAGQQLSYVGSYNKQDFNALGTSDAGDFYNSDRFAIAGRNFRDPAGSEQVCTEQGARNNFSPSTGDYYQCTHTVSKRYAHEVRLSSLDRIGGIFDYVVGALFDKNKTESLNLTQEQPIYLGGSSVFVVPIPIVRAGGDSRERSFFGNVTAHLGDFELSGGVRFIDYKQNAQSITVNGSPSFIPAVDQNATVYTASAKYQITRDLMVYATVGSSFRPSPFAIGNFTTGPTGQGATARELQFTSLPAEKSTSYEIGAKTSFLDGRGRFNISLYRQDFDNFVYRGPGVFYRSYSSASGGFVPSVGSFNFISAVPVRVEGVEGEASFQILRNWSLGVNASYANGRIRNGTIACTDLNGDGLPDVNPQTPTPAQLDATLPAGQNLATCSNYNARSSFAPKFSGNIQTEYSFSVNDTDAFVRGLFNFSGENAGDPNNLFDDVSAYGLLNLYAGVRDPDGAWEITAFAKNLLREQQVLSTTSVPRATTVRGISSATNFNGDYVPVTVTAPREFGISFRAAFGSR